MIAAYQIYPKHIHFELVRVKSMEINLHWFNTQELKMDMHIHFELARVKRMEIDHALIDTLHARTHGAALAALRMHWQWQCMQFSVLWPPVIPRREI